MTEINSLDFIAYLQWHLQQGEFDAELTIRAERKIKKIKAICDGDTELKDVFNSERVFGKHFVSGKPARPCWHKHDE